MTPISQAPKPRINSIDALRGFALFGILMFHCMEHFDLMIIPQLASPFWQAVDSAVFSTVSFLFAGKAYAIFSLLFGLSFFMQMQSQADRGVDFRWRFLWRLTLLLGLGYLNGVVYMGEFFVVYALLGVTLIPLYKLPSRLLAVLAVLMFLQIPDMYLFVRALNGGAESQPTSLVVIMDVLYAQCAQVFAEGSLGDVLRFNLWDGLMAKLLWVVSNARYTQLIGLFIVGLLIGRAGIHKDPVAILRLSRRVLPWAVAIFGVFYALMLSLPYLGVEGFGLQAGKILMRTYANLGQMALYICAFMLLYYKTNAARTIDYIAPVGRMSVTNYMIQGFIGVPLFYGFGLNLAFHLSFLECLGVGFVMYTAQILWSNWWMRRYYYGPVEWLWRTATWFQRVPMLRK